MRRGFGRNAAHEAECSTAAPTEMVVVGVEPSAPLFAPRTRTRLPLSCDLGIDIDRAAHRNALSSNHSVVSAGSLVPLQVHGREQLASSAKVIVARDAETTYIAKVRSTRTRHLQRTVRASNLVSTPPEIGKDSVRHRG